MGGFGQSAAGMDESFVAENDLSAKQFYAVEFGGAAGQVDLPDSAGDVCVGVLQNKPKAGEAATVRCVNGTISKAIVDGNSAGIGYGDPLKAASGGKLVKATADKDFVVARALAASTADGDIIDVMIEKGYLAA